MNREIVWSSAAENDLVSVLEYLNLKWNSLTANTFLDILDKNIIRISSNPKQFPFFNKTENIRRCVITKHNTLYFSEVLLLRIYDVRQKPSKLKF